MFLRGCCCGCGVVVMLLSRVIISANVCIQNNILPNMGCDKILLSTLPVCIQIIFCHYYFYAFKNNVAVARL